MAHPTQETTFSSVFEIDRKVKDIIGDSGEAQKAYLDYVVFSQS